GSMLAEALCKLMGFTYAPSQNPAEYWRHGHSTESDFIYVTTRSLTHAALKKLSDEVGPKRTLLICCKAYNSKEGAFENLTIRKIPLAVLSKCEWGRDDYSLRVANLPPASEPEVPSPQPAPAQKPIGRRKKAENTPSLFDIEEA
ncbi:MAG: site-specific DNA-methyltransferase, partial [Chthoniobacterales bacterium]